MGLAGGGDIWLGVWGGKWDRGLIFWQLGWEHGAGTIWSAQVCSKANSFCSRTEAADVGNHEHSSKSGGDYTAGAGRYITLVYLEFYIVHVSCLIAVFSSCLVPLSVFVCVCVCAGITLPSLTSSLYFGAFLSLVWWWVFGRSVSLLLFSSLCVLMAIFSGGHLLALYLYQLPLSQQLVPPEDVYARCRSWSKSIKVFAPYMTITLIFGSHAFKSKCKK